MTADGEPKGDYSDAPISAMPEARSSRLAFVNQSLISVISGGMDHFPLGSHGAFERRWKSRAFLELRSRIYLHVYG